MSLPPGRDEAARSRCVATDRMEQEPLEFYERVGEGYASWPVASRRGFACSMVLVLRMNESEICASVEPVSGVLAQTKEGTKLAPRKIDGLPRDGAFEI